MPRAFRRWRGHAQHAGERAGRWRAERRRSARREAPNSATPQHRAVATTRRPTARGRDYDCQRRWGERRGWSFFGRVCRWGSEHVPEQQRPRQWDNLHRVRAGEGFPARGQYRGRGTWRSGVPVRTARRRMDTTRGGELAPLAGGATRVAGGSGAAGCRSCLRGPESTSAPARIARGRCWVRGAM